MPTIKDKPTRRIGGRRLLVVLILLAFGGLFTWRSFLPWLVENRLRAAAAETNLSISCDGISIGRSIRIASLALRAPDADQSSARFDGLCVTPDWRKLLGGRFVIRSATLDRLQARWFKPESDWLANLPERKGAPGSWIVHQLNVRDAAIETPFGSYLTSIEAGGVKPGAIPDITLNGTGPDSATRFLVSVADGHARLNASGPSLATLPVLPLLPIDTALTSAPWELSLEVELPDSITALTAQPDSPFILPAAIDRARRIIAVARPTLSAHVLASNGETLALLRVSSSDTGLNFAYAGPRAGKLDGRLAFSDSTLSIEADGRLSYESHSVANAHAIIECDLDESLTIHPGSRVTFDGLKIGDRSIAKGDIAFAGDYTRGFNFTFSGFEGTWSGHYAPNIRRLDVIGKGGLPPVAGFTTLRADGGCGIEWRDTGLSAHWDGRVSGARSFGNIQTRFDGGFNVDYQPQGLNLSVRNLEVNGRHKEARWNIQAPGLSADWKINGASSARLQAPARVSYAGHEATVMAAVALDKDGNGRFDSLTVNDIPLDVAFQIHNAHLTRCGIKIPETKLARLVPFLPPEYQTVVARSNMEGTFQSAMVYLPSSNSLDGNLQLDLASFNDATSGLSIEGLSANIPVRQRFVSTEAVVMTSDEERWPEVPMNLSISKIGRFNVTATSLAGRILFADYILRARDVTFNILDAGARARFMLDPFRNPQGRWRSALELKIDRLPLRRLYEEFIGTGRAAQSLTGNVGLFIETGWSDTECLEGTGKMTGLDAGVIGAPVIRALAEMLPKENRPPGLALLLLGNYYYDSISLELQRDPSIHDFRTRFALNAPREPFLQEFRLEVPLLTILDGLPVEVKSDIRAHRARSRF